MEEVLIPIDSRYRNTKLYPSEGKFTINLDKSYKNIVSANLASMEITNSLNLIETEKSNNYFTLHLPNKLNDPDGIKISLDYYEGLLDSIVSIKNAVNSLLNIYINNNSKLYNTNKEKYFYIFYLDSNTNITFTDVSPLLIRSGWMSIYGLVQQIYDWVFIANGKTSCQINSFTLSIFDRRFTDPSKSIITCIRNDIISQSGLINNLQDIKAHIYSKYITDTTNFIPIGGSGGILDILVHDYGSVYYITNDVTGLTTPQPITTNSIQLYNILMDNKCFPSQASFSNNFSNYKSDKDFTFYVNYKSSTPSWAPLSNFINKNFLKDNNFILELNDPSFTPNLSKDIPQFEIDFSAGSSNNPIVIKSSYPNTPYPSDMTYKSLGYYLGFRQNSKIIYSSGYNLDLLTSFIYEDTPLLSSIIGAKKINTRGDVYIFLRINDWGYIKFFDKTMFSKILFFNYEHNMKIDNYYIMKEYQFRQPVNVQKLEIELVDYLGNTVDLNGIDFSFTLSLRQVFNTDQKASIEKKNLVFSN